MNRDSHALFKAALLILGFGALIAAALLCVPSGEVQVYGNFSPYDLSRIKQVALRHTRVVALGNLSRSILKPTLLPTALRDVFSYRVCSIDRCWNNEVSVNTGSPWIGFLVLVNSNGNWRIQGSSTFPPPREPVPDADPSRRHPVSISVPTGLRLARKGDTFGFIFTGSETAQLTVGLSMLTGITEAVKYRDGSLGITSTSGNLLRLEIQPPTPGYMPDNIPVECRITIYETDQPSGYHVDASDGKFYRVLWTHTFEGPFE